MKFFNYYKTDVKKAYEEDQYGRKTGNSVDVDVRSLDIPKIVLHSVAGVFGLIVAMNSYTTVPAGHVKVKTLFGKVHHEEYREGFHLVNPLSDFTLYDTRNITYGVDKIMVPSQDKLKTQMDVSIIFNLDPSLASNMKAEVGDVQDFVNKFLKPKARSTIREVGKGVKKSQDFFLDHVQQDMQTRTLSALNEFLENRGVVVSSVLFRDVTLPRVVSSAIIQTKQRQEDIRREEANLAVVEKQAQQQVKQAEARESAAIADANAKRTLADAAAYEIEKIAESQAKANSMVKKTLTEELIKMKLAEQWDGKYPTHMLSEGSNILIGAK